MTSVDIHFRSIQDKDKDFLFSLYASTRTDVAAATLEETEKQKFLEMQFKAQSVYYPSTFPNASFDIIMLGETPIGRLYIDRPGNEIHIIDIALMPTYRRKGFGSQLMQEILEESRNTGLTVRIYVEVYNTAFSWYKALGFEVVQDIQTHYQMHWSPDRETTVSTSSRQ